VQPGSTCSAPTNYLFAGMERDSESSLYHTWFRQYDASQGRWMSVDPLAGNPDDPQSQDRYVYVLDDPTNLTDPLGLLMYEPSCERDGMDVWGPFCDPDRPGGGGGGGDGPGRGPEDETGGGGGKHECWAKARRYASRRCGLTA